MAERPLLIGLGAADRGDDAVGLIVAGRLRTSLADRVRVVEGCADALSLVALWQTAAHVVVVDALHQPEVPPGAIRTLDLAAVHGPAPRRVSGHGDALGGAWRLAGALGVRPRTLRLVGVVGADFTLGAPLSPPVRSALDALQRATAQALAAGLGSAVAAQAREPTRPGARQVSAAASVEGRRVQEE